MGLAEPRDPVHSSTPLPTSGVGWGTDFDLVICVTLCLHFSHKKNTYSLLQAEDRLSDLSQSLPTTGFHRAIIRIIWTELQCDTRHLGVQNQMKMFMGVPAHQTTSDCLSGVTQLYLGYFSEHFFPVNAFASFPQSVHFFHLSLLFSLFTRFHLHEGRKPHSRWYPPPRPERGVQQEARRWALPPDSPVRIPALLYAS